MNVLAFATRTRPFDRPAVRQAAALLVDRARLVATVPPGTIDPLWSTVPGGVDGHLDAFRTASGPGPDAARARKLLDRAGLSTPVPLTLGYDPGREATGARAQVTELAR